MVSTEATTDTTLNPAHDAPPGRRTPWPKRVRHAIEAMLIRALAAALRRLPRSWVMRIANITGAVASVVLRADRRVAFANLDLAFGDAMPARRKARIVRGAFQQFARSAMGLFWLPRLTPTACAELIDAQDAIAELRALEARGRGMILATCHYGDWELMCAAAGRLGVPIVVVTEPMPNPRLGEIVDRLRASAGNIVVPPRYAVLKLLRALKRGGRVAIMVDVNGRRGRGGVWLDFLGRPVFNGSALGELALRTGAAVFCLAAKPVGNGRYRVVFRPAIEPQRTGDHPADVRAISQQCLDFCAGLIRDDPGPWLWTYKRWKRRPTPDADGFPFYSKHAKVE